MKCPRTNSNLKPIKVGGITVDISEECGGVFFDSLELKSFDEKHEIRGEALVNHLKMFENAYVDESKKIKCPKCVEKEMFRRFYSSKRKIEIDECYTCGGIWLDAGELEQLRELFPTEKDRNSTSEEFMDTVVNSNQYKVLEKQHNKSLESLTTVSKVLNSLFHRRRGSGYDIDYYDIGDL
jgi:Zn-finger nucleic acid-binding protein